MKTDGEIWQCKETSWKAIGGSCSAESRFERSVGPENQAQRLLHLTETRKAWRTRGASLGMTAPHGFAPRAR